MILQFIAIILAFSFTVSAKFGDFPKNAVFSGWRFEAGKFSVVVSPTAHQKGFRKKCRAGKLNTFFETERRSSFIRFFAGNSKTWVASTCEIVDDGYKIAGDLPAEVMQDKPYVFGISYRSRVWFKIFAYTFKDQVKVLSRNSGRGATKTVYFVRHGQALHNVANDFSIRDPKLTHEGEAQSMRVSDGIPAGVQLIVASPLKRTIETTLFACGRLINTGTPVELHPDLQEVGDVPCDTGSPVDFLLREYEVLTPAISKLPPLWFLKTGGNAANPEALSSRAERMKQWLLSRPEEVILVVSHNQFLRYLLGNNLWSSGGTTAEGFSNGEARGYTLAEDGSFDSLQ